MSLSLDADPELDVTPEPPPFEFAMAVAVTLSDDPQSVEEVKKLTDWPKWEASMKLEIAQHNEIGTWKLVQPPCDINIVGCCWVFHYKHDASGNVIKHKSRLIAQGFTQTEGID